MFSLVYATGGAWNETMWNNEKFDKLLVEARAELDSRKRRNMYSDMQRIVRDEGGALVPIYTSFVQATTKQVQMSEQIASNLEFDGHKSAERWWFA